MIYTDLQQRSDEWLKMRIGCVTASRMCDVLAKLKRGTGEAAARRNYRNEKISERLTGFAVEHYVSMYMEEGMEYEPVARAAYEHAFGIETEDVGFALHDRIQWFGASPDALVGADGLLEIKCLKIENHLDIIRTKEIPLEFQQQMLGQMSCTERKWCDFVAYCPKLPPVLRLFVKRLFRDEKQISALEAEVEKFNAEVEQELEALLAYVQEPLPTEDLGLVPQLERSLEKIGVEE